MINNNNNNNTITARVTGIIRHGATVYGNPMLSVKLDEYVGAGSYGIVAIPRNEATFHCYECKRSWNEETPAGRCPWEDNHYETVTLRISNNSGIVYAIENPEFYDMPHTFKLTAAYRVSNYVR